MPDHVHLLLRPREPKYSITTILKQIKAPFAKALATDWQIHHPEWLVRLCAHVGSRTLVRIWQPGGGFDRNLYSETLIRRAVEYIEANPVRRGLVVGPREWTWSSARARAGETNAPIRVDEIRWEVETRSGH